MIITASEIREIAVNDSNWDLTLLTNEMIEVAEKKHLVSLVGAVFYNKITSDTASYDGLINGETITQGNIILTWSGLKKMLAWFVLYENIDLIHNQIRNTGIQNPKADSSELGDLETVKMNLWGKATSYIDDLYRYCDYKGYEIKKTNTKIIGGFIL